MTHMNSYPPVKPYCLEFIIKRAVLQSRFPIMLNRSGPLISLSVWLSYCRHQLLQNVRRFRITQEFCQRSKICCLAF